MLADLNASWAGFTSVASLATSKVSMAPFSEDRTPSGLFSGPGFVSIVEEQGDPEGYTAAISGKRLTMSVYIRPCWTV